MHDVPGKSTEFGAAVQAVQVDLRTPEGVEHLFSLTVDQGREPAAAALNAGIGTGDMLLETELADDLSVVDLNVRSTVHLAKLLLPDMVHRGEGKILFTSSVASMMPGSYQSVYNASKSFIQSFSEAFATSCTTPPSPSPHSCPVPSRRTSSTMPGSMTHRSAGPQGGPGAGSPAGIRSNVARGSEGSRWLTSLETDGHGQPRTSRQRESPRQSTRFHARSVGDSAAPAGR